MKNISVVIPLYNSEKTIRRTLNSVFNQTVLPFEVIVVNDGSNDNSLEILKEFNNDKIKIFSQKNKGVSSARNVGIEKSICDYIAFLDSDDEWLPDFLFEITELLTKFPDAAAYGTAYLKIFSDESILSSKLSKLQFKSEHGVIHNYFEVCNHSDPPIWSSAVCIKREILKEVNGFPIGVRAGEDLITWAKIAQLGDFAYSTKNSAKYYQHDFNPQMGQVQHEDYVGIELKGMLKTRKSNKEKIELRKYIGRWHKMRAALFLITGKDKFAIKEIKKFIYFKGSLLKGFIYLLLIFFPLKIRFKILFTKRP